MPFQLSEARKRAVTATVAEATILIPSVLWDYALVRILSRVMANVPLALAVTIALVALPSAVVGLVIQANILFRVGDAIRRGEI